MSDYTSWKDKYQNARDTLKSVMQMLINHGQIEKEFTS